MSEEDRQAIVDAEHVRVLSLCYYVSAGIHALFSLFGLLYAFMGVFMTALIARMPQQSGEAPPPEFFGLFFGVFGVAFFVGMIAFAALQVLAATRLRQRRSRTLCMIIGAVTCVIVPYGTALGVFTFVVLSRRSIAGSFDTPAAA